MRWVMWWQLAVLLVLHAGVRSQRSTPTACEEKACRCDSFTRLVCNCTGEYQDLTLRPDGAYQIPRMATAIFINGCDRVTFLSESIRRLFQLKKIDIINVKQIIINERALAWSSRDDEVNPGLRLTISNSTITEICSHAIQGHLGKIVISDSRLINLKPFAFTSLTGIRSIELTNNIYDDIEIQAFKKFTITNFIISGGVTKTLPSRFLSDVEITDFLHIQGVVIECLSSLTFLVNLPKRILVENNIIDILEGDSFHITSKGPITFRNNTITTVKKGAFLGFTIDAEVISTSGRQKLLIDNNTITNITPSSLIFNQSTLSLHIDGLNLNKSCDCDLAEAWQNVSIDHGGIINCWYDLEGHYVSMPTYIDSRCGIFKQTFWIFVLVGIFCIVVGTAIVIFFIVKRENKKKKKGRLVLPDGKTYRETEFHIVVERAELLTTNL